MAPRKKTRRTTKRKNFYKEKDQLRRNLKSRVNEAGNYTKPTMRKRLFEKIKAGSKGGKTRTMEC